MAGSERSGVEAADRHLFENAYYVLTPDAKTPPEAVARLEALLQLTRAKIVSMDAIEHDEIVGAISHLPHMIAAGLVNQVADLNEQNGMYELLAAGGFRDITRIASCDPIVWRDILLNNREVLMRLLMEWQERMGALYPTAGRRGCGRYRGAVSHGRRLPQPSAGAAKGIILSAI